MWEKLSDDGSIHDQDDIYTWDDAFAVKVAALNSGSFAGYQDWRLPNGKELQSIVNYDNVNPAVSPAFNTGCAPGCTVTTCSCTVGATFIGWYWASSTDVLTTINAHRVGFDFGVVGSIPKTSTVFVRAVRGGS